MCKVFEVMYVCTIGVVVQKEMVHTKVHGQWLKREGRDKKDLWTSTVE